MFKVLISTDREFNDFSLLEKQLNFLLSNKSSENIEIISNHSSLSETYSKQYKLCLSHYNQIDGVDACICFWNGSNKDTKLIIDTAKQHHIPLRVIYYGFSVNVVQGDLFENSKGVHLAHCISSDAGVDPRAMTQGIAYEFIKRFDMKRKIVEYSNGQYLNIGEAILIDNTFNLITKDYYYNKPTYDSLRLSLISLKKQCISNGITELCIPKIGSGLDKLSFNKVLNIIKEVFETSNITITVYYI